MPEVSVISTFFNGVAWLREAVQSVLDQTFRDFELILVDGASTEPLTDLPLEDHRIRYIRQPENLGASAGRNLGMDLATGRFIAFLDADDLFIQNKLERQVAFMLERSHVAFTHTSYWRISADGDPIEPVHSGAFETLTYPEVLLTCPIATPTVMIRADARSEDLRFDESIHGGEDTILWAEFAQRFELFGIDELLTKVRMHEGSFISDPQKLNFGLSNLVNSSIARSSPVISALRRALLSQIYLCVETGLWRHSEGAGMWRLDSPAARGGGEEAIAAIAELEAIIRDLHWTLEQQAGRLAGEIAHRDREEAAERDREIARLRRAVARRDRVLAPVGVLALSRLIRRLRGASDCL